MTLAIIDREKVAERVRASRVEVSRLRGAIYRGQIREQDIPLARALIARHLSGLPEADQPEVQKRVRVVEPDWSVLEDEVALRVADAAARIVSAKYRERSVSALAERDDLRQEALLILATSGYEPGELDEGVLRHRLVMDLLNLTERGYTHALERVSLEALEEGNDE